MKFSQQNQKIVDAKKYPIEPDIIVRPGTSYFVPQNPGKHFNKDQHKTTLDSTPLKSKNEKYKQMLPLLKKVTSIDSTADSQNKQ